MIKLLVEGQKIELKITKRNIGHFKSCGYENISVGDVIYVSPCDLSNGSKYKVDVVCDYCGEIVKVQYKDYLKYKYDKYSCSKCRAVKMSEYTLAKRRNDLYERASCICKEIGYELLTPIDEIFTADTRVVYRCPKHGVHETKIYTLICGHGCKECGVEHNHIVSRKTPDDVYEDFKNNGGILLNKEDYQNWNCKNLKVICPSCGEMFTTSYCSFMQRNGQLCPKCAKNISKHEHIIKKYLEEKDISFYMQYRFDDCRDKIPLPFDFYLYDFKIAIEYDGEGHYIPINRGGISDDDAFELLKDIQRRDLIKTNYCRENNVNLIRIPYWDGKNIREILDVKIHSHKDIV